MSAKLKHFIIKMCRLSFTVAYLFAMILVTRVRTYQTANQKPTRKLPRGKVYSSQDNPSYRKVAVKRVTRKHDKLKLAITCVLI